MGQTTDVLMNDGVSLRVYRAEPEGEERAGIVIMHEGTGLNDHIRDMCERYAAEEYLALAPALYDRVEKGVELKGYGPENQPTIRSLRQRVDWDRAVQDMCAVADLAREAGKVGVVGYCWGGSFAWLASTRCDIDAAVIYYGGDIMQFIDEKPKCPIMGHFGDHDEHVAPETAERVKQRCLGASVYMYDAGHGFNCDRRSDYDAESANLAQERTSEFFAANLAGAPA